MPRLDHIPGILLLAGVAALCGACTPLAVTPPFHLTETAEILRPGQVAVTAAGGGAFGGFLDGAGGGAARVRVGVGARQEVGIEGGAAYAAEGTVDVASESRQQSQTFLSGKLSWKAGLTDWLAVVAGVGAGHEWRAPHDNSLTTVGGDAGAVASPPRPLGGRWLPYGGLRLSVAVPVDDSDVSTTVAFAIPVGVAFVLTPHARLFAEVGGLEAHGGNAADTSWQGAGYGALGFTYLFGEGR
jgi:hypothetical protein